MTRIHEQMYLEFNQQNKNSTQTLNIMWQLLWLNMTLRQHGLSDLHLDFCVFFSNQYCGRKFRSKGSAQEYYDWKNDRT